MSDKENTEEDDATKDSPLSSPSSNFSSAARSIVNHTIENAINKLNEAMGSEKITTSTFQENNKEPEIIDFVGEYDSSEREAFLLVDRALNNAIRRLEDESKENKKNVGENVPHEIKTSNLQEPHLEDEAVSVANVVWPQISNFTVKLGDTKIGEFIATWNLGYDWLYCIDYLGFLETRFDKRHRYRARFSIPTMGKPVPLASASVYFTIIVSKIKPPHYIVEVLYVVESNHLIHKPGEFIFCELWLRRIIDHKTLLMKRINF